MNNIIFFKKFSRFAADSLKVNKDLVFVPLFKNPNSPIISSLDKDTNSTNTQLPLDVGPLCGSQFRPTPSQDAVTPQPRPEQSVLQAAVNNLVFLQKKGSQTSNPNLISYNFPGSGVVAAVKFAATLNPAASAWLLPLKKQKLDSAADDKATNYGWGEKAAAANAAAALQACSISNPAKAEPLYAAKQPQAEQDSAAGAAMFEIKTKYNINKLMNTAACFSWRGLIYELLFHFFKSMFCLISKPVFINTPDTIKIQLFYFLCLPKILTTDLSPKMWSRKAGADANSCRLSGSSRSAGVSWNSACKLQAANLLTEKSIRGSGKQKRQSAVAVKIKKFNSKDLIVRFYLKNLAHPECNLTKVYPGKFKLICSILSKFFNKSVELDLIRLHQPYYDSNILVNYLGLITAANAKRAGKKNIGKVIHTLFNRNIINGSLNTAYDASCRLSGTAFAVPAAAEAAVGAANAAAAFPQIGSISDLGLGKDSKIKAYLSGLNIKISGRLMREPIIPRVTTKKFDKGFTATGKINYSDVATFTHKNRKGAFTITVKSGQNF
jgi:hypothetical protein